MAHDSSCRGGCQPSFGRGPGDAEMSCTPAGMARRSRGGVASKRGSPGEVSLRGLETPRGPGGPPHSSLELRPTPKISGQGSVGPASSEAAGGALLFLTVFARAGAGIAMRDRAAGPPAGRCPLSGGLGRPAHLVRLGRLDRCAGSARERIERGGLLSSSGVPSWRTSPLGRTEAG